MTCNMDRELLSLYVNDDLNPQGRAAITEHLGGCEDCRQILAQYRAGAEALATVLAGTPVPSLTPRHPTRRYLLPSAAATLLLALLLTTQVKAVGGQVFKLFPTLQVETMPDEEVATFSQTTEPPIRVTLPVVFDSVVAVEAQFGFDVGEPAYLPEGTVLNDARVFPNEAYPLFTSVTQAWAIPSPRSTLFLSQTGSGVIQQNIPESANIHQVLVKDSPALFYDGIWRGGNPDGTQTWVGDASRTLVFQWEGQSMELRVIPTEPGTPLLAPEELIKIAESIQ